MGSTMLGGRSICLTTSPGSWAQISKLQELGRRTYTTMKRGCLSSATSLRLTHYVEHLLLDARLVCVLEVFNLGLRK